MDRIKTIIIDDEWLIRSELKTMLVQCPNIEVIGEAANVSEGIKLCENLRPDLIFLDIHMPCGSGFDFLKRVKGNFKLVFISAYDQYLSEAKKYEAIDYLMKPISKDKLLKVIHKL
ncbi:response regulator [candidate division KSB1 bacterium]|nr:response regulator [candidate division KSB1 bacterium]